MNDKTQQISDVEIKQNNLQEELKRKALSNFYELSEKDFYPPEDKRVYKTGMCSSRYDSYSDYVKWFYDTYEKELFDN